MSAPAVDTAVISVALRDGGAAADVSSTTLCSGGSVAERDLTRSCSACRGHRIVMYRGYGLINESRWQFITTPQCAKHSHALYVWRLAVPWHACWSCDSRSVLQACVHAGSYL